MTKMDHKIKELTDKIHQEGFEKANHEAEKIIAEARKEAEELTREAEKRAERIIADAKKQAEDHAQRIDSEVRLSSRQSLMALKKEISDLIQASVFKEPLDHAFEDKEFIRKILETLVENWDPSDEDADLRVLIPEERLEEMDVYLKEKAGRVMNKRVVLGRYSGTGKGFEIQPSNGHYKINVTDEAFELFLNNHFKPRTLEFLYGGSEQ